MEIVNEKKMKETVYSFYPQGFDFLYDAENYKKTDEYLNLVNTISRNKDKIKMEDIFNQLDICDTILKRDYTMFFWGDRSYNFQLLRDFKDENYFVSLCINISVLIPYYYIHLVKTEYNQVRYLEMNKININEAKYFSKYIDKIKNILNKDYNLKEFPEYLSTEIIPDISNTNYHFGYFTYYNAFYSNDYYTRL